VTSVALVIGAGPAGLAAAAALAARGIGVTVLERERVGAAWRGRHVDLRLNTMARFSGLPGAPIPRSAGRWPGRDAYVAYLESFARDRGLDIRTGVEVVGVSPTPDSAGWRVETAGSGPLVARHVIVATGDARVPHRPSWSTASAFRGDLRHVAEIGAPAELAGRDVLVVGGGNSGVEWVEHLARVGAGQIWLSIRTPPNLLPREVGGIPLQGLAVLLRRLPTWLKDADAQVVRRLALGDLARYGLPRPAEGPYRHLARTGVTVAVDTGFAGLVRAGRVEVVSEVERLEADRVVLGDGRELRPSSVLAATGYRPGLEPLLGGLGVLDPGGRPRIDARGRSARPGLWFIGFTPAIEGVLRRLGGEARTLARAIAAEG
jgi:putative flavoprotein involved in K+ transport